MTRRRQLPAPQTTLASLDLTLSKRVSSFIVVTRSRVASSQRQLQMKMVNVIM
eukprot:CAMPEP_0195030542 /NCGR_PEP_ID=MMETSP0326_2-20130528/59118_1 /TAXON_ID=2866 ORGANISM="Crypthecodinium cohnii, Strain Seligo" /NCGR_SAMPLE_ID=MMETSP0326_2 /ASSEMBLY_ACC=CAM_ASM_000348 /LENGTH=52 /DNA_ID=CAMNT_0040053867 /DNA_START=46 /DNA_END=204 /DNA_ORIENTATION=+